MALSRPWRSDSTHGPDYYKNKHTHFVHRHLEGGYVQEVISDFKNPNCPWTVGDTLTSLRNGDTVLLIEVAGIACCPKQQPNGVLEVPVANRDFDAYLHLADPTVNDDNNEHLEDPADLMGRRFEGLKFSNQCDGNSLLLRCVTASILEQSDQYAGKQKNALKNAIKKAAKKIQTAIKAAKDRGRVTIPDGKGGSIKVYIGFIRTSCISGRHRSTNMAREMERKCRESGVRCTVYFRDLHTSCVKCDKRDARITAPDTRGPCGCVHGAEYCGAMQKRDFMGYSTSFARLQTKGDRLLDAL